MTRFFFSFANLNNCVDLTVVTKSIHTHICVCYHRLRIFCYFRSSESELLSQDLISLLIEFLIRYLWMKPIGKFIDELINLAKILIKHRLIIKWEEPFNFSFYTHKRSISNNPTKYPNSIAKTFLLSKLTFFINLMSLLLYLLSLNAYIIL